MGQEVEDEVAAEVVSKVSDVVDVATKTLQTDAAKKIALKNAKISGVKLHSTLRNIDWNKNRREWQADKNTITQITKDNRTSAKFDLKCCKNAKFNCTKFTLHMKD